MINKKRNWLLSLLIGTVSIVSIGSSVILLKNYSKSNENENQKAFSTLKNKIEKVIDMKLLKISYEKDLNLQIQEEKEILKSQLLKIINEANNKDDSLSNKEIENISIINNEEILSFLNPIEVKIKIQYNNFSHYYKINLIRIKSSNEKKFKDLKLKFENTNKELILKSNIDLKINDFENQIKIKNSIFDAINNSNKNQLTQIEKKAIKLINRHGIITHDQFISIEFLITFGLEKKSYIFKIKRIKSIDEINLIKFNKLKNKFDQIILVQTLNNTYDLDIIVDQIKIKQFIVDKINQNNKNNELTIEEKQAITLSSTSKIITHTNTINVNFMITFGLNTKTYTFKLARTKSQVEIDLDNFNALKNKFDQIILSQTLSDKVDLDLFNNQIQTKVKQFIFNQIDIANSDNELSIKEKQAILLATTSGIITHTNTINVSAKITFGLNTKTYIFKLARTKSNDEINLEKFNNLKSKIKVVNKSLFLNKTTDFDLSLLANRNYIKNSIINEIDIANANNELTQEEKNAIKIITKNGIIDNNIPLSVEIFISFGANENLHQTTIEFYFLRENSIVEQNQKDFDILKSHINKINKKFIIYNQYSNLELNVIQDRDKIKKHIINEIEYFNNLYLNPDEVKAISIETNNGIITHNVFKSISIKITFGQFEETFNLMIKRVANNEENKTQVNNFVSKIKKAISKTPTLITNEKWFWEDKKIPSTSYQFQFLKFGKRIKKKMELALIKNKDPNEENPTNWEMESIVFPNLSSTISKPWPKRQNYLFTIEFHIYFGFQKSEKLSWKLLLKQGNS